MRPAGRGCDLRTNRGPSDAARRSERPQSQAARPPPPPPGRPQPSHRTTDARRHFRRKAGPSRKASKLSTSQPPKKKKSQRSPIPRRPPRRTSDRRTDGPTRLYIERPQARGGKLIHFFPQSPTGTAARSRPTARCDDRPRARRRRKAARPSRPSRSNRPARGRTAPPDQKGGIPRPRVYRQRNEKTPRSAAP